ncbi:hypothetical protein K491DRAFT_150997 [Lophiostoma macrostomum CBS 122681]|uniref:CENP-V/GFA domain-containing protein n=1 Tax=Lophiostoma macrostomum CBS 122681 TaxID=1314788 RepID=A0A6A6TK23_9PLEO|nr:hypothetical protein K491DRAFT_150997 [Lophiostoma macrostomum CBS 122681]
MASPENSTKIDLSGSCLCNNLKYHILLDSKDDARTTLCHCGHCKKAFGGAFGLTSKVPLDAFRYKRDSGKPTVHAGDNGFGNTVYREFCHKCGCCICEYGEQARLHFRYVALGSLDDPSTLPPKGEFYCSQRESWMPEIPGKVAQFVKM